MRVGLVIESGEPREVHHFCALLSYGADAINPYLAFETLYDLIQQGVLKASTVKGSQPSEPLHDAAVRNYIKALNKGFVKVMSKMGISTVQSYRGAQIFEAIGLDKAFVDKYFTYTASRIGGIGLDTVAREIALRHHAAFPTRVGGKRTWVGRRIPMAARRRISPV